MACIDSSTSNIISYYVFTCKSSETNNFPLRLLLLRHRKWKNGAPNVNCVRYEINIAFSNEKKKKNSKIK